MKFIQQERLKKTIYPNQKDIFNAFYFTKFSDIKVVILGQDPYFSNNQAHGLAFSIPKGYTITPSLQNIYKELNTDFNKKFVFHHGCLIEWAKQGVFLLNSILTVESGKPRSHYNIGWEIFTDTVIHFINYYQKNIIFLLWGKEAQKKSKLINHNCHYILESSHPSPLSSFRGFLGCKHFSKTNEILTRLKKEKINWFSL